MKASNITDCCHGSIFKIALLVFIKFFGPFVHCTWLSHPADEPSGGAFSGQIERHDERLAYSPKDITGLKYVNGYARETFGLFLENPGAGD